MDGSSLGHADHEDRLLISASDGRTYLLNLRPNRSVTVLAATLTSQRSVARMLSARIPRTVPESSTPEEERPAPGIREGHEFTREVVSVGGDHAGLVEPDLHELGAAIFACTALAEDLVRRIEHHVKIVASTPLLRFRVSVGSESRSRSDPEAESVEAPES